MTNSLALSGLLEEGGPGADATLADRLVIPCSTHKAKGLEFDDVRGVIGAAGVVRLCAARTRKTTRRSGGAVRTGRAAHQALRVAAPKRFAGRTDIPADGAQREAPGCSTVAATRARRRLWLLSRRLRGLRPASHYVQELVQSDGSRQWLE